MHVIVCHALCVSFRDRIAEMTLTAVRES
jgi:hypothetical protein